MKCKGPNTCDTRLLGRLTNSCIRILTRRQFVDKRQWHWAFNMWTQRGGRIHEYWQQGWSYGNSIFIRIWLSNNIVKMLYGAVMFRYISSLSVLCHLWKYCCVLCCTGEYKICHKKLGGGISENISHTDSCQGLLNCSPKILLLKSNIWESNDV